MQDTMVKNGSWIGKAVIELPDGTFLFDNMFADTIVIKTQANINDSWILYDDDSSVHYQATLTSIDTMTILGNLDSIKRISITAYDNSQILTMDPINNAEIILSKNYGFVKTMDLYTFPYHEPGQGYNTDFDHFLNCVGLQNISFNIYDFHIPTFTEIYDLNVGDVFGYDAWGSLGIPSYWIDSVISKTAGPNQTSYTFQRTKKALQTNNTWLYTNTQASETIWNTPIISLSFVPEEWGQTVNFSYNLYNGNHCFISPAYYFSSNYIIYDGDTAYFNTFEPCGFYILYKEKFGRIDYGECFDPSPGNSVGETMVYSKKSGQAPCGTAPSVLNVTSININTSVDIYPNPVSDILTIRHLLNESVHYEITNLLGQALFNEVSRNPEFKINVANYSPGIYSLKLATSSGYITTQKISIVH
jgi:hypothetical protein